MHKKLLFIFTMILFVGCRATYNDRLAISKNSNYSGQSSERNNFIAILKTLKPATNKKPELYHIRLQKSGINAYNCTMYWIIGDVQIKKFNLIGDNKEENIFALGKGKFSPNSPDFITGFNSYFIESSYANSIKKVLLLDKNDNVLTEFNFDKAEIIEKSDSDNEYIFGKTKADKVKYAVSIKDTGVKN